MQIFTRLISAGFKAIFTALGSGILLGAGAGGVSLLVAYQNSHLWPATTLSYITAGVIAVMMAYLTATTVLLRAIAREVVGATKAVENDAEKVVTGHA